MNIAAVIPTAPCNGELSATQLNIALRKVGRALFCICARREFSNSTQSNIAAWAKPVCRANRSNTTLKTAKNIWAKRTLCALR